MVSLPYHNFAEHVLRRLEQEFGEPRMERMARVWYLPCDGGGTAELRLTIQPDVPDVAVAEFQIIDAANIHRDGSFFARLETPGNLNRLIAVARSECAGAAGAEGPRRAGRAARE